MNAKMSVTDVTVIETPPCFNINPIRSWSGKRRYVAGKSSQHAIITNISSTPASGKGIITNCEELLARFKT